MYAVVRSGGKQYRVSPGGSVRVEKLSGEVGASITLEDVLMIGGEGDIKIGAPTVDGASVNGTIVAQGRGAKIRVFKMKRRKGYRRSQGHRQDYTEIRIDGISGQLSSNQFFSKNLPTLFFQEVLRQKASKTNEDKDQCHIKKDRAVRGMVATPMVSDAE